MGTAVVKAEPTAVPTDACRIRQGDHDLAQRAGRGDRRAFHEIVDRHADGLFRLARTLSRTHDDAEDIVQETLVAAFQGISRFDGRASLKTWLSRILVKRAAKAWHRSRHSRSAVALESAEDSPRLDRGLTTGAAGARSDQKMDLATVLPSLTAEYRQVLVLREAQGMSYAEIAQTLNIPQGTVESRLHRARRELRDLLKAYGS